MELAQKLFQVTSEVAGLREKLQKAEEGKQDAVRKMEAAQVKSEIVQRQMAELGEQKHADVSLYPYRNNLERLHYRLGIIVDFPDGRMLSVNNSWVASEILVPEHLPF